MALDSKIVGSTSGNIAEVDANNQLQVTLPVIPSRAGYVQLAGQLSASADPAGLLVEGLRASAQGRLAVGQLLMLFSELFNNTTLNSATFTAPVATATVTVAGGTLNLNASLITTANAVSRVQTWAHFPLQPDFATTMVWDALLTQDPQTNCTVEMGVGIASALLAPTDGVFFRFNDSGVLVGVMNTNGTEVETDPMTAPETNVMHRYRVTVENDRCFFYINGECQGIIETGATRGFPVYAPAQPAFFRVRNAAVAPALAVGLKVGSLFVGIQDAAEALGKDNATIAALMGRMGSQGQTGNAMGSTALLTNSLAAGAGVAMTNTTAALGSGLGGQFATQPTLAVGTDGIVCSYLNPIPTSAIPGKTLYLRGVRVQGVVTTALTGGPVAYEYQLAYGHTAVSMATAEAATTKAARRVGIGIESFAAAAAVGVVGSANGQYMPFNAPIAINPGEYVAVTAKNLGVVTSAGVILFLVSFDAYWE
jgi:hypothetical protein